MKNNVNYQVIAPIAILSIVEQTRPTRYSVTFPKRNVRVTMTVRQNHLDVDTERMDPRKPLQGVRLRWSGKTKDFRRQFVPELQEVDFRESFRRYVSTWFARQGELIA